MPSCDHDRLISVSPFTAFRALGFDLSFLICITGHKAPSVFRSLSDMEREASSIKGTRDPLTVMRRVNSESAVGEVPMERIAPVTGLEIWQRREGTRPCLVEK